MKKAGCRRVMIVTDKGIENAGLLDDGLASLKESGINVTIFNGVKPDPPE
jgi:alcohol dehydrogenase class IV